ncbi:MAG: Endonuclease [Planctomycetaceae bacterium]|nr:Endonuclease [Planctomycetaceae bacterium]
MAKLPPSFADAMPEIPDLPAALRLLVEQIPPGRVATYGQLAEALGSSHAAKWVASWLIEEPPTARCPTHRVVRADGSLGDYRARSAADQAALLEADGIAVVSGKVDLSRHAVEKFQSNAPLQSLADWQTTVAEQVSLVLPAAIRDQLNGNGNIAGDELGHLVGGVDVSYTTSTRAVAAYVLVDINTGELVWSATHEQEVRFPYISGFLALREIPIILPLLETVKSAGKLAPILFVDGHGTLHRRKMGIASHLGIVTGLSTIGVGKTLSLGQVDMEEVEPGETRPIIHDGQVVGTALRPFTSKKPLYFSPGHRMDLATATDLVCRLNQAHRLPDPTYWADRLSRAAARLLQSAESNEKNSSEL